MNLLLLGPRACGKTTIGRILAARLERPFVDLDERTQAHFGVGSITEAWSRYGEASWREAECQAFLAAVQHDGQVIALGGGTPMIPQVQMEINQRRGAAAVRTIYLKCPPDVLVRRLSQQPGDRPSLTGADVTDEVRFVLAQREVTYTALADVVHDVDDVSPEAAATALLKILIRSHQI